MGDPLLKPLETERVGRLDLLVLTAVAAALRFWAWGTIGLDHFDEGGYAMSARSIAEGSFLDDRYPLQHFLSPPFLFGVAGSVMRLAGPHDFVLSAVSAVMGIATVALAYLAATRWFGREAGLATGLLVALADFHVLYSRSGLTDVSFTFWFVAAVFCFAESERRGSWLWAVLAGVTTGMAWNTKYHGWLAIGVGAALVLMGLPRSRRDLARGAARVGVAAGIAAAMYLPWALFIMDQPGGYGRLAEEHAHYLRPLRALRQTWYHLNTQLYLDGWLGRLAPGLAAITIAFAGGSHADRRSRLGRASIVGALGLALGNSLFAGVAALAALPRAVARRAPGPHAGIAFFALFCALTPLYYPYPRLVMPWLLAAHLLAGSAVALVLREGFRGLVPPLPSPLAAFVRRGIAVTAAACCAVALFIRPPWQSADTFQPKDGFRLASSQLAERIPESGTVVVWGEPGVVFYLRDRFERVHHVDDLRRLGEYAAESEPLFLVTSIYANRIGGPFGRDEFMAANPGVLEELASFPVRAISDVRILDDFAPWAAMGSGAAGGMYDLRLYAVSFHGAGS